MSRLHWSVAGGAAVLSAALLLAVCIPRATPGFGAIRAVIDPGTTSRSVDVAVVDASGHELAGENRGAGQSEVLQEIPAGRVLVTVGVCSVPTDVRAGRTAVVRFDPTDCMR